MHSSASFRAALFGTVFAVPLFMAPQAVAQEGGVTALEEIVVQGEGEGASGVGEVEGVVAKKTRTGSKAATDITEIPQSVSVIGREEIDDQGAQKADEALRYTAGVLAQPFGADSDTNWLFIRGFQATDTGVYLDGLQLFSLGFGGFYIDTFGLERIEVLKGPASVLYGGSNPGGMINYVSKRPTFERHRYAETGVNDAGNAYFGFDVGDVANDVVSYRINGKVAGGNTYFDYQHGWRGFVSPSITWKPDEQTSLTILANYTHIDENHGGGSFLPYYGTVKDYVVGGVNYGRIPRDFNYSEPSIDRYDRRQGSIGYEFEHTFDNDWTVRSNARFAGASIEEVSVYPNGWSLIDPTELARINFGHDTQVRTFLIDNQVEGKVNTGPVEHTILAGLDYKNYNIDQVQSSGLYDPDNDNRIDPFDPVYGRPLTPRVSYLDQDLTQQQLGIYAQDQLRFGGGWLVTLNGRYDWVRTEADNRPNYYDPNPADFEKTSGAFSGRAGLAYEFANGVTPYVSAATFFNPVLETDRNGQLFDPEEGVQYEAGIKYAPTFIDGLLTLSVFDLTRRNVLTAFPNDPFTKYQTGEVRSRGVELEGKVNVTEDLKLTAALTAYDIDITKDNDPDLIGKTPFIVPEVMASASVDYTFRGDWYDGISVGAGVRYVGSSWADNENTLKVPAATLVDAKVGYERDNWGVDLNVTNLFDEDHVSSCQGSNVCSYGEGRSFKLKAHVTW